MRSELIQNTISDMTRYIKNIIPPNIPETYTLKAMFENVSGEKYTKRHSYLHVSSLFGMRPFN